MPCYAIRYNDTIIIIACHADYYKYMYIYIYIYIYIKYVNDILSVSELPDISAFFKGQISESDIGDIMKLSR